MEPYALSRVLGKLELYIHVTRGREGAEKIVSLRGVQLTPHASK